MSGVESTVRMTNKLNHNSKTTIKQKQEEEVDSPAIIPTTAKAFTIFDSDLPST